jgi:hypothetical protein
VNDALETHHLRSGDFAEAIEIAQAELNTHVVVTPDRGRRPV